MDGIDIVLLNVVVFGFTAFMTIGIIKGITNYRLRKRMIDAGLVDEKSMELLKEGSKENFYSSLKWGLIFFFSGIGLMLIEHWRLYYDSSMAFGIVITAASLGFLLYFVFMRREMKKEE
jgi:hypothetical protein